MIGTTRRAGRPNRLVGERLSAPLHARDGW
ncbi:hypothetical protein BX285_5608 [Streptomyces sp. 1114.5]|nr:hypothetical protein BX285_5608 [Streptomyces sp. 1114.5]